VKDVSKQEHEHVYSMMTTLKPTGTSQRSQVMCVSSGFVSQFYDVAFSKKGSNRSMANCSA